MSDAPASSPFAGDNPQLAEADQTRTDADKTELLERLRGPGGLAEKARILSLLQALDADLSAQAAKLQSSERMKLIEAGRLAVASAVSIMNRIEVSGISPPGDLLRGQKLPRSNTP